MRNIRRTLRSAFERVTGNDRRRAQRAGRIDAIPDFASGILSSTRQITVYLPPGYDERRERYPVLYVHDGQNVFDPERAFIPGQHWRLQEAADAAIAAREASPAIIVAIDNAGSARIDEYTPDRDEAMGAGGRGDDYGRLIVEELKPLIDGRYRTKPEAAQTAIGGSSLGGLISLHLALRHGDVFASAAVMSPSVWWNGRSILEEIDSFDAPVRPRIWLDVGGREGHQALADVRALRSRMMTKGWNGSDFRYHEDRSGDHSERAWAARARKVLEFLFPPE